MELNDTIIGETSFSLNYRSTIIYAGNAKLCRQGGRWQYSCLNSGSGDKNNKSS